MISAAIEWPGGPLSKNRRSYKCRYNLDVVRDAGVQLQQPISQVGRGIGREKWLPWLSTVVNVLLASLCVKAAATSISTSFFMPLLCYCSSHCGRLYISTRNEDWDKHVIYMFHMSIPCGNLISKMHWWSFSVIQPYFSQTVDGSTVLHYVLLLPSCTI